MTCDISVNVKRPIGHVGMVVVREKDCRKQFGSYLEIPRTEFWIR